MKDEVLQRALIEDDTVVPRYDLVLPDGTKLAENAQIVLKNRVLTAGTPLNKSTLLSGDTSNAYGLDPDTSVPDDVLRAIRNSVGYCPRLQITFVAGGTVYIQNISTGNTSVHEVPASGVIIVDVLTFGVYKVWGSYQDATSAEEVITVDTVRTYYASITQFSCTWRFTVDAEVGATITVSRADGFTTTGTVGSDKKCTITLSKPGTYSAVGTYDGCASETYSFTAKEEDHLSIHDTTVKWYTITVNIAAGSVVALTSGIATKGGIATNGTYKTWLPTPGTWLVTCTLNNKAITQNVVISEYKNYTVTLEYYVVYGVKIPLNSSSPTSLEYTDEAVGMSTGYAGWSSVGLINRIKPCVLKDGKVQYYLNKSNLTKKEDGTSATLNSTTAGDVMVEIPKIGYRMYTDNNYQYIKITDQPDHPDYCYLAHSLDSAGDCDKIYIAAYLATSSNSKLYSVSGATPVKAISLTNARTYAQARGTGYQLLSFYPWTLIQCLYTIMYKNLNSVQAMGYGYTDKSSAASTGGTNVGGPCVAPGATSAQISFMNIEDTWGNMQCHLDGICIDSNGKLLTAYKGFDNDGNGYPYSLDLVSSSTTLQGYIKAILGSNVSGFVAKDVDGSSSTYYCDWGSYKKSSNAIIGSPYNNAGTDGNQGIYCMRASSYDMSTEYVSARIMYKHKG